MKNKTIWEWMRHTFYGIGFELVNESKNQNQGRIEKNKKSIY